MHKWLGLVVALYVIMASLTGAALMFRGELLALAHPQLGAAPSDSIAQAERLAAQLQPGSFTAIRFPDDKLAAFVVHRPDHRTQLHDPVTLAPVPDRFGLNRALDWTFDLHHYLLAGETGRIVSGMFGLAIAGLILIGLSLWWPWRRGWRLRHARPRRPTRTARLAGHTTLAILIAPALLLAAITGSAIVFHETSRNLLVALLGEKDPAVALPAERAPLPDLARTAFPNATPRLLIPPKAPGEPLTLRLRQPAEPHPNGRSTFSYDPAIARAAAATSEPESGAGPRLYNLLYPLHTGSLGGLPLRLFLLASALAATSAAWLGFRSALTRRRRAPG